MTQIATTPAVPDMILSASRGEWCTAVLATLVRLCVTVDKSIIMWNLTREDTNYGIAKKALKGHNHFVSDVVISSDGQFALSGSWDNTLRLWDLST